MAKSPGHAKDPGHKVEERRIGQRVKVEAGGSDDRIKEIHVQPQPAQGA